MNNSINFQLEKLAETIEQMNQRSCDLPVDCGWTAENFEKIEVDVIATRISEYVENNQNQELVDISKALKSMRLAMNCSDSPNKNLSRHAKKLLKSWCHPLPNFINSAENFVNLINQFNYSDEVKFDELIPVCDEYRLAKIVNVNQLQYVGNTLDNCVANSEEANEYVNRYKDGEIWIWTVLKGDEPIFLLTINNNGYFIDEFQCKRRKGASKNEVPYELAIGILNKLDTFADDVKAFVQAGAFSRFKSGRPKTIPIEIDGVEFWLWSYHNELIIGIDSNSDGNLFWSYFEKPFAAFDDSEYRHNDIKLGRLFDLAMQSETLMNRLINPTHH